MAEPDAARNFNMGPGNMGAKLNIQTEQAQAAVNQMTAAMKGLEKALQDFGNNAYMMAEKINRHLKSIGDTATQVTQQLAGVGAAVGGVGGTPSAGARSGSTPVFGASSKIGQGAAWVGNATSSATSAIDRVVNKDLVGGLSLGTFVGTGGGEGASGLAKDLALAPLRYLRSRINTNRDTAIMASGALNMTSMQQQTSTANMMSTIARFPGSIYGTPQDMLQLYGGAGQLGASYNFQGKEGGQGVRARGFYEGIRQMQQMNPLASVNDMMGQLGGLSGDTGAQQRSVMLTGGAMSMIGAGGRQKSLSEWAESILRWFEGLRPGALRGKGFDYGQLMAQYFPGSNIDAWFQTTGVPQNIREYWWTYALSKANKTQDTTSKNFEIGTDPNNVAFQRLRAGTELTRTEFSLAGQMSGQYAQRESSNRWFNELMGSVQKSLIPLISKGPLAWIQYLPDSVEDLMMTGAERGASALFGGGDVGDIGDSYGEHGGTGISGLHPDMKSKVSRMMRANPKLRMNSGLRDTGLQQRLKSKGYNNVSGKPSAHTRGMAADLGPASQYKWIAANAKRFGLASGRSQGEPWHVGMPGDIRGGGLGDVFDDFIDDVKGFAASPEGMASMITKIVSTMTGAAGKLLGPKGEDRADFAASPDDLYNRLAGASQKVVLGIPVGGAGGGGAYTPTAGGASVTETADGKSTAGTGSGWAPDGRTWRGTAASGRGDKYNMTATADIMADIQSNDAVTRGSAVAKALHNAGFSGANLKTMLEIAYRESSWTTNKWVLGPEDTGGGILGVNQMPWTGKKPPQQSPYTQADVLDPQASAYIAMDMYKGVSPLNRPGPPNSFYPWKDDSGNPLGNLPQGTEFIADQALKKAGLGDLEEMRMNLALASPARRGGAGISFSNTFNLSVPSYGGGSNAGIDVRRTASLLADHLEGEMKKRLARSA